MIYKTYISKYCTIVNGSKLNSGINQISELTFGKEYSRMLIYFDHNKIKEKIEDKTFADKSKIKHYLRITNAGSIDFTDLYCDKYVNTNTTMRRAVSFDLIFFLIPNLWDCGKGYYTHKVGNNGDLLFRLNGQNNKPNDPRMLNSEDGCNWFQSRNGYKWNEEGVFSNETLSNECEKYCSEEGSKIIIARQHFDVGNENINIDITDIIDSYIDGSIENYGIGIAYYPSFERKTDDKYIYYTSFFTNKTNTFFEPYVETVYDDYINDNRGNFSINKNNRLYLYTNIGGKLENLDELPICKIDEIEYNVIQQTKGVYYAEVFGDRDKFIPNSMYYDVWSNIKYDGIDIDDVEMDFVVNKSNKFFNFGNTIETNTHLTPSVYGINDKEDIKRGDVRKITLLLKENYSKNKAYLIDDLTYRVYIKDGTRELDILTGKVNKTVNENFFTIDTSILIPQRYYIDIKIKYNMEEINHSNIICFNIVDDLNNKYN